MPNFLPIQNNPTLSQGAASKKVDPGVYGAPIKAKTNRHWWWPAIILLLVIIIIGLGFLTKMVMAVNSTNELSGKKISFFEQISHLIVNPEKQIGGEPDDRINILLAGIGGAGHDGAYLADTIIIVSLKPSTNEVATLSIPRDLYVEIPGYYGSRKINNALAFGREADYPGGGEALLTKVVKNVTGLNINYYVRVDFEGFRKAIDDIGGIDVYIDNSFADYEYPDYNHGYQTISFKKGPEHMNGERALQFVRSRHGNNGEGSDFARSKRQQKVIFAMKEKFFSINTIINPNRILSALDDFGDHNKTNLQLWEITRLASLAKNISQDNVVNQVLETGPNGQLVSDTTVDGAYILRPKSGNYQEIQYLAKNIFNISNISREKANIEIQNSTKEAGLATKMADLLRGMDYNVVGIGNTQIKDPLHQTTIYDLSGGAKPYTVNGLKNYLNAGVSSTLPAFMSSGNLNFQSLTTRPGNFNLNTTDVKVDLLIIIGNDQLTSTQTLGRRSTGAKNTYQAL